MTPTPPNTELAACPFRIGQRVEMTDAGKKQIKPPHAGKVCALPKSASKKHGCAEGMIRVVRQGKTTAETYSQKLWKERT